MVDAIYQPLINQVLQFQSAAEGSDDCPRPAFGLITVDTEPLLVYELPKQKVNIHRGVQVKELGGLVETDNLRVRNHHP